MVYTMVIGLVTKNYELYMNNHLLRIARGNIFITKNIYMRGIGRRDMFYLHFTKHKISSSTFSRSKSFFPVTFTFRGKLGYTNVKIESAKSFCDSCFIYFPENLNQAMVYKFKNPDFGEVG